MNPILFALGVGALVYLAGCAVQAQTAPLVARNTCRKPNVREFRLSPALAAEWSEPLQWALDRWKQAVPAIAHTVIISDLASEEDVSCVTSVVPYNFPPTPIVWGQTGSGYIRVQAPTRLQPGGKRALMLHELGHLLFELKHTTDISSIMFPTIQDEGVLSASDEEMARAAYLLRDGAP